MALFHDRDAAAQALIPLLPPELDRDWLVLALPRGGVPIAAALARHLGATLDLMLVRKVGVPGDPELALAAVTGPGPDERAVNHGLRESLGLTEADVDRLARPEIAEIARRRALWAAPGLPLAGRKVLIVDDGMATGATLRAAVEAARRQGAARIGVALPVALGRSLGQLHDVSPVICPHPSVDLGGVGAAYADFPQVPDTEVTRLLAEAVAVARP